MRRSLASLCLLALAGAAPWTPDAPGICGQATTTVAIASCLQARTTVWDGRLNQAFRAQMSALAGEHDTQRSDDLRRAERAWIAYRDANCRFYGDEEGTIREIDGAECLRRMTQDRAIELGAADAP